jgi:hypothetical protein
MVLASQAIEVAARGSYGKSGAIRQKMVKGLFLDRIHADRSLVAVIQGIELPLTIYPYLTKSPLPVFEATGPGAKKAYHLPFSSFAP